MLWHGPGFIRAAGSRQRPVTSADIAPTIAKLLGFPFKAPDGSPMDEAIKPGRAKPKLIVVMVWDAGGRYVLGLHPGATPHLRELIRKGTWFDQATIGSFPSNTAPIHATIGTGAFPSRHGVVDTTIRFPDGHLADPWSHGPGVLRVPVLADEYAKAMGAKARTAMFGTTAWHLGMVGQGGNLPGGVKHIAVLREKEKGESGVPIWHLPRYLARYYTFPAYVNNRAVTPPLASFTRQWADALDGKIDGTWRGHSIHAALGGWQTPARIPYQTQAIKAVIEQEHLGQHDEADLLFINYKIIDEVGHRFFADSIEMDDTIRVQDQFLDYFISFLDNRFRGRYVFCLTADHGHTASPGRTGGVPLLTDRMEALLRSRFDTDGDGRRLVQDVLPSGVMLNRGEVRENDSHLSSMANYLAHRTVGDLGSPSTIDGSPEAIAFDAVFPGSTLKNMSC